MLISFVFSFRNEVDNLNELVTRVANAVDALHGYNYEMIFVDDASTDGSVALLKSLQKSYPITIVGMSRRFGVTPCVLAGFAESMGDVVVYMDSDLQDPPELLPNLLDKFHAGAEVVHTTRVSRDGETKFKMFCTNIAYSIINMCSEINLPTNTGDYKLLSRRVVNNILKLQEVDPYMRGLSIWVGFNQDTVYYKRDARFSGKTKFPLFSRGPFNEFVRGVTAFSAKPLYLSFFVGVITTFVAVLLIFWGLFTKLIGISSPGISGLLISICFFSGVLLITNGIVGIYIAKIFYEVKGRPKYIISNIERYEL